jgi:arylsulfatase
MHEGGIATPFIVHAPSLISESMKGKFYREYGQLVDIMATCLDLAGAKYPEKRNGIDVTPLQGTSLKPALAGGTLGRKTPLYWEHEGKRAIRDGKWKLVANGPAATWELYDIEADRGEMNNLVLEHRELAETMATQWEDWAKEAKVFPWPWAQYRRKFGDEVAPTGLVFELLFENSPLKDSSAAANSFTITGTGQNPQLINGVFNGNTGIIIAKSDAFDCSNIGWRVEAEITPNEPSGLIMAQGGITHGYSLYLDDGKPGFAVRIGGNLHSITGSDRIEGSMLLSGSIMANRRIVLQVNGKTVAEKGIPGLIQEMPVNPSIIGKETDRPVVEPMVLPAFKGTMKRVSVYRGG